MSNIQKQNSNAVAKGSLRDIAHKAGITLAEAFMSCDAVVLVDVSGSMTVTDALLNGAQESRYRVACDELEKLQATLPGKVAVIAFSDHAEFCPSGLPRYIGASTDMAKALEFIKVADGCGIKLVLISDGEPNDAASTLAIAKTFTSKIDVVYIGPTDGAGERFLAQLAACTGGIYTKASPAEIAQSAKLLLGSGD